MWHYRFIPAVVIAVDLGTNEIEARLSPRGTYGVVQFWEAYKEEVRTKRIEQAKQSARP
jgi:hypothetical protein